MSKVKIKGFNDKEQRCYEMLADGEEHSIAEMKKRFLPAAKKHCQETYSEFEDHHVDSHAQSFVRNSLRRLIRDGWIEKTAYGTYKLTTNGKRWVKAGKDETASYGVKRGRKPGTKNGKSTSKKAKTAASKARKKASKAKTTKAKTTKKASAKKASAKKANGKKTTKKASSKKTKASKAGKEKAKAIKSRVAKQAASEKAKQSIAQDAVA